VCPDHPLFLSARTALPVFTGVYIYVERERERERKYRWKVSYIESLIKKVLMKRDIFSPKETLALVLGFVGLFLLFAFGRELNPNQKFFKHINVNQSTIQENAVIEG